MDEQDLEFIQWCVRQGRLLWTYHVTMRLRERGIARNIVMQCVDSYRIIETYSQSQESRYLPSCLVYAMDPTGEPIHLLFALDRNEDNVRVVTAYRPDPEEWQPGFTRRRES